MAQEPITFVDFARLVLDAIEAAELEYLIGGAVAVWAWGEVRTTQDFDLVIYITTWVTHLGVAEAWAEIQAQAQRRFG